MSMTTAQESAERAAIIRTDGEELSALRVPAAVVIRRDEVRHAQLTNALALMWRGQVDADLLNVN
jgi:hypothetical protein